MSPDEEDILDNDPFEDILDGKLPIADIEDADDSAPSEEPNEFEQDDATPAPAVPAAATQQKKKNKRGKKRKARAAPTTDVAATAPSAPSSRPRKSVAVNNPLGLGDDGSKGHPVDAYLMGQIKVALKQKAHNEIFVGSALDKLVVGLPIPALVFEYLLALSAFPMGLIMQLLGTPGSCKSSLLFEIIRWFRECGGGGIVMENEDKISGSLAQSIIGWNEKVGDIGLVVSPCDSVNDWIDKLISWLKLERRSMLGTNKKPDPKKVYPVVFGVDSIMGKSARETQERLDKKGAGRNFPLEAMLITGLLRRVPHAIAGWPFSLILVNHMKLGKDDRGFEKVDSPGGQGVDFQESFRIEARPHTKVIECVDWDGVVIKLKCAKNSYGPTHRGVVTRMLWWDEEDEDGNMRQKTVWDWDWAAVNLLLTREGAEKNRLSDLGVHVVATKTGTVENLAWSKNLGMKADDAVPWAELGSRIRQDEGLLNKIRQALRIRKVETYSGDYFAQVEKLRKGAP